MREPDHRTLSSTDASSVEALLSELTCNDPYRFESAARRAEWVRDPRVLECLLQVATPREEPLRWLTARGFAIRALGAFLPEEQAFALLIKIASDRSLRDGLVTHALRALETAPPHPTIETMRDACCNGNWRVSWNAAEALAARLDVPRSVWEHIAAHGQEDILDIAERELAKRTTSESTS